MGALVQTLQQDTVALFTGHSLETGAEIVHAPSSQAAAMQHLEKPPTIPWFPSKVVDQWRSVWRPPARLPELPSPGASPVETISDLVRETVRIRQAFFDETGRRLNAEAVLLSSICGSEFVPKIIAEISQDQKYLVASIASSLVFGAETLGIGTMLDFSMQTFYFMSFTGFGALAAALFAWINAESIHNHEKDLTSYADTCRYYASHPRDLTPNVQRVRGEVLRCISQLNQHLRTQLEELANPDDHPELMRNAHAAIGWLDDIESFLRIR